MVGMLQRRWGGLNCLQNGEATVCIMVIGRSRMQFEQQCFLLPIILACWWRLSVTQPYNQSCPAPIHLPCKHNMLSMNVLKAFSLAPSVLATICVGAMPFQHCVGKLWYNACTGRDEGR